jgi:DNA-binding MarR family transcriptional regulator
MPDDDILGTPPQLGIVASRYETGETSLQSLCEKPEVQAREVRPHLERLQNAGVVEARRDGKCESKIRVELTEAGAERFEQYVETLQSEIESLD